MWTQCKRERSRGYRALDNVTEQVIRSWTWCPGLPIGQQHKVSMSANCHKSVPVLIDTEPTSPWPIQHLARKRQGYIFKSLVWLNQGSNPWVQITQYPLGVIHSALVIFCHFCQAAYYQERLNWCDRFPLLNRTEEYTDILLRLVLALPMRLKYVNKSNQYWSSNVVPFMWLHLHYQCTAKSAKVTRW